LLAEQIEVQYNVEAKYIASDLSIANAAEHIAEWCYTRMQSLSILVNNAGYGLWGDFEKLDLGLQQNMLQLNIGAVTDLTHQLLPLLKQQKQACILNVASTAAYQTVPTLALYAASKAFILS